MYKHRNVEHVVGKKSETSVQLSKLDYNKQVAKYVDYNKQIGFYIKGKNIRTKSINNNQKIKTDRYEIVGYGQNSFNKRSPKKTYKL